MTSSKWREDLERILPWRASHQARLAEPPLTSQAEEWQELSRALIVDSQEIDGELRAVGIPFSVGELTNVQAEYPEALPTLLRHLRREHLPNIEESIIRALSVSYGGAEVYDGLREHLMRRRGTMRDDVLFALGNALAITGGALLGNGDLSRADDLASIANDSMNGSARHQPLRMLSQMGYPGAEAIALGFLRGKYFPLVAFEALRKGRIRSTEATDFAKLLLAEPGPEARKKAQREVRPSESPGFLVGLQPSHQNQVRAEAKKYLKFMEQT